MDDAEKIACLRLNSVLAARPDWALRLIGEWGSAGHVLKLSPEELSAGGAMVPEMAGRVLYEASRFDAESEMREVEGMGGRIIVWGEGDYPELLRDIPNPPLVLYFLGVASGRSSAAGAPGAGVSPRASERTSGAPIVPGLRPGAGASNVPELCEGAGSCRKALAIVGTRRPTLYGQRCARKFAREASRAGLLTVSGLARGVDTIVHRATLDEGGCTWAVLGSGLKRPYPRENARLMREIVDKGGAVISEFSIDSPPFKEHFPRRNRILSGLALGVLVVEGDFNSGALITARAALEQGREVFAVPGPVDSPMSRGPHHLIRQGAKLAESFSDISEEIPDFRSAGPKLRKGGSGEGAPAMQWTAEEREILDILCDEGQTIDGLQERTGWDICKLNQVLFGMEIKRGIVISSGNRVSKA